MTNTVNSTCLYTTDILPFSSTEKPHISLHAFGTDKNLQDKYNYAKEAFLIYNAELSNTDRMAVFANSAIDTAKLTAMQVGFTQLEALDKAQKVKKLLEPSKLLPPVTKLGMHWKNG